MNRTIAAIRAVLIALLAAGCGSNAPSSKPTQPGLPATTAAPTTQAAVGGPSCTQQVQIWLRQPDGTGVTGNVIQHDIEAMMFAAKAYVKYQKAFFLSSLRFWVSDLTDISVPDIPACADPQGLWGTVSLNSGSFLGDASNVSNDTAGTSQAMADCQAMLSDFASLKSELASSAPGARIKGLVANP